MPTQYNLIENFFFIAFKWKQCNISDLPKKAVQGGTDVGGEPMFVGRAMHNGVMLPAKIIPANGSAYVCK